MTEHILVGHFLLRSEAARRAGISKDELTQRPDLLRIGGTWLEEVYFEFQFDGSGVRSDLGSIVRELRRCHDDLTIADWLASPNEALSGTAPLRRLATGGSAAQLAEAVKNMSRN